MDPTCLHINGIQNLSLAGQEVTLSTLYRPVYSLLRYLVTLSFILGVRKIITIVKIHS